MHKTMKIVLAVVIGAVLVGTGTGYELVTSAAPAEPRIPA